MLSQLNLDSISNICMYCDYTDIKSLMITCSFLNSIIPIEWTYHNLSTFKNKSIWTNQLNNKKIISGDEFSNDMLKKYKFIKYFSINFLHFQSKINNSSIYFTTHLKRLTDIDISYVSDIKDILIQSPNIKELNIQACKEIRNIHISDKVTKLVHINISNSPLNTITIEPTWTRLKSLVLVGTNIKQLYIPKECIELNFINVSGSMIDKITYDRLENPEVSLIICHYTKNEKIDIYKKNNHKINIIPSEEQVNFYFLTNE